MDIQVVDIPDSYGILLNRDWSKKLNAYISIDFTHMWLPWKGQPNQIRVSSEPHLKEMITEYNNLNEVHFAQEELGVYIMDVASSQGGPCLNLEYRQTPLYHDHLKKGICSTDSRLSKEEALDYEPLKDISDWMKHEAVNNRKNSRRSGT